MSERRQEIRAARRRVVEIVDKDKRTSERWLVRALRPLFSLLPVETQLQLAKRAYVEMTVALMLAEERFGPRANVRVDGSEVQVGYLLESGDFVVLGRGLTAETAIEAADARDDA